MTVFDLFEEINAYGKTRKGSDMMNPKVMLRELRRQERQCLAYVRSLGKEADLAMKRWNNIPLELAAALEAAKSNLREIRKDIREWRGKVSSPTVKTEEE